MHSEAAKQLSLTEEEFICALDFEKSWIQIFTIFLFLSFFDLKKKRCISTFER